MHSDRDARILLSFIQQSGQNISMDYLNNRSFMKSPSKKKGNLPFVLQEGSWRMVEVGLW